MAATLLELRNRVYSYLNDLQSLTTFTGSGDRYPSYVVNSVINDSIRHYVKVLNANYQGYLSNEITLSIVANVNEYALPSTFRSPIYDIRRTINQIDYPLTATESYHYTIATVPTPNEIWLPSYAIRGQNIWFSLYPTSNEADAVRIRFQRKVTPLTTDGGATGTLIDELYDAEDCIVIRSVVRLLQAKDVTGALKSITGWKEELRDVEAAFWLQVGNRYMKLERPVPVTYGDDFYT